MENLIAYGRDVNTGNMSVLKSINNTLLTNYASTPIGTVNQYAGSTAPLGWLICDGSAISRTTYSDLFAIISTTYGSGDGSTTFNIPNLQNRLPIGKGSGNFATLNTTGGSDTTALTLASANIPSHSHFLFNHQNYKGTNSTLTNTQYVVDITTFGNDPNNPYNYAAQGVTTAANVGLTSSTGSGTAFNAMPPYIVLNYIIYTGYNVLIVPTTVGVANLSNLSDVSITSLASNQLLKYTGSIWANSTINTSNLTDVTITTPATNQLLKYNGTVWANSTINTSNLTDVTITSPSNTQLLIYNGTVWVNSTIPIGGCYNGYYAGAFPTIAPATTTTGVAFSVPVAGNYILNISCSAYYGVAGIMQVRIYMNGIDTTYILKAYTNEASSHKTLVPISFKYALNAGNNYLYPRVIVGTSDANDFLSFNWIYSMT